MESDYQVVYTAHGQLDAEMIKAFLQSNGIEVIVAGESAGTGFGIVYGPLGDMDIYVPNKDADHARSILDAMERGDLESDSSEG